MSRNALNQMHHFWQEKCAIEGSSFKNSSPRGDKNSNPNPNLKDHQNTINNLKLQQGCLHLCKVSYTHTYCSYKVWWSLIQLQLFYIYTHTNLSSKLRSELHSTPLQLHENNQHFALKCLCYRIYFIKLQSAR